MLWSQEKEGAAAYSIAAFAWERKVKLHIVIDTELQHTIEFSNSYSIAKSDTKVP